MYSRYVHVYLSSMTCFEVPAGVMEAILRYVLPKNQSAELLIKCEQVKSSSILSLCAAICRVTGSHNALACDVGRMDAFWMPFPALSANKARRRLAIWRLPRCGTKLPARLGDSTRLHGQIGTYL